jgi:hypothetical protein
MRQHNSQISCPAVPGKWLSEKVSRVPRQN